MLTITGRQVSGGVNLTGEMYMGWIYLRMSAGQVAKTTLRPVIRYNQAGKKGGKKQKKKGKGKGRKKSERKGKEEGGKQKRKRREKKEEEGRASDDGTGQRAKPSSAAVPPLVPIPIPGTEFTRQYALSFTRHTPQSPGAPKPVPMARLTTRQQRSHNTH